MSSPQSYTVGVDLGATKILVALVDSNGKPSHLEKWATPATASALEVMAEIGERVRGCLAASPLPPLAVGVGVAAQVDRHGLVRFAPNLRWREEPLGARLSETTGLPVRVLNDVRAATVAEWQYGAGRGVQDLVCLFIGTGFGGGAVIDGRLVQGASNAGAELGHLTVASGGRRCTCGNPGCLESYVSGWGIAARAREAAQADRAAGAALKELAGGSLESLSALHVALAQSEGDALASRILRETEEYLASGLVSIANAFNPRLIIMGGGVVDGTGAFAERAFSLAKPRMLPSVGESIQMTRASLGETAVAVGAATFARAEAA